ncbi:MAG: orotate phosphoribosyltransferase [Oscillospiraceae bacterium]|jgi:orotate phosphoribosyltransferase|nr:orotate phosphoribosyltransferase [Oscillospiraceae bacterium]
MEPKFFNIPVCVGDVTLRVAQGHFATRNSHTNYFIDVTRQQSCLQEADAVAQQLAQRLASSTMVDTILCMDGTRVIGTCLARKLTESSYNSVNSGKEIYLLRENVSAGGKLIFRENARFMLEGRNVLLLLASITTGSTVEKGMRCVQYYGGSVAGVASIYSHLKEVSGTPVVSLFDTEDLPGYASYPQQDCPLCREGKEVDAIIDKYGYEKL